MESENTALLARLKLLEDENRRLHFEKAGLVSTLIDIKPSAAANTTTGTTSSVRVNIAGSSCSSLDTTKAVRNSECDTILSDPPKPTDSSRSTKQRDRVSAFSVPLKPDQSDHTRPPSPSQPHKDLGHVIACQALDIESLSQQCEILKSENKKLVLKTLDLHTRLIQETQTTHRTDVNGDSGGGGTGGGGRDLSNSHANPDLTYFASGNSDERDKGWTSLHTVSEDITALTSTVTSRIHPQTHTPTSSSHLADGIAAYIHAITSAYRAVLSSTDLDPHRTRFPALLTDPAISTLETTGDALISAMRSHTHAVSSSADAATASAIVGESEFKEDVIGSITNLQESVHRALQNMHTIIDNKPNAVAEDNNDPAVRVAHESTQTEKGVIDYKNVVRDYEERIAGLEFDVRRMAEYEKDLESVVEEWRRENESLRKIVDQVSGIDGATADHGGGGGRGGGVEEELKRVMNLLEDERLKCRKAGEVIKVLRTKIGASDSADYTAGGGVDDLLSSVDGVSANSPGGMKSYSAQISILRDTIGRSVVEFEDMVKVMNENMQMQSKISELEFKLNGNKSTPNISFKKKKLHILNFLQKKLFNFYFLVKKKNWKKHLSHKHLPLKPTNPNPHLHQNPTSRASKTSQPKSPVHKMISESQRKRSPNGAPRMPSMSVCIHASGALSPNTSTTTSTTINTTTPTPTTMRNQKTETA
jgi:hypothetical protein